MLDLFAQVSSLEENKLHPKFKLLRDNINLTPLRAILETWADGFIDRDNKIIKEFQISFHSVLWELYIHAILKEMRCNIDFSKPFPDFIITNPEKFLIECVVSEIKATGIPETERTLEDIYSMLEPLNTNEKFDNIIKEAITRHSNSILSKYSKYINSYQNAEWVKNDLPYIIALGSYDQINYGKEFWFSMFALLYGIYYNPVLKTYERISEIIKPGTDSSIPVGLFRDDKYKEISAVIFSCTLTLGKLTSLSISNGDRFLLPPRVICVKHNSEDNLYKVHIVSKEHPEYLSDGLFIFYNPFAQHQISQDIFKGTNILEVRFDNGLFKFEGANMPIISRVRIPSIFLPDEIFTNLIVGTFCNYNM